MADLLVAWDWEYDAAFVDRLARAGSAAGVRVASVRGAAIADAAERLARDPPALVVDRASDVAEPAARLAREARRLGARVVNDPDHVDAAVDKATMHLRLLAAGVHVPWTILLSPLGERIPGELDDLPSVGKPFVVKPARGGGGDGVVLGASGLTDILVARAENRHDKYLVQEQITPVELAGRPAYFRVLHCLGDVHPCFWDPATRCYTEVPACDRGTSWCLEAERVARVTAGVSGMALFSTELAWTARGILVAVDYVNDMCDLRPASEAADGVPDRVVDAIVERIVRHAAR